MRLLITGICGFVGSRLARYLATQYPHWNLCGFDNFVRPGSELHRPALERIGIRVFQEDLRSRDLAHRLPECDWVIDCAANPSVLAGLSPDSPSQEVLDHNLAGTIHLLEYCKRVQAGLVLISTSRVYSAGRLSQLPVRMDREGFAPDWEALSVRSNPSGVWQGLSERGIDESFSTESPLSLYGVSKLASEWLAHEYSLAFGFPLWINRCGVLAGAGQFGRADQGIIAYWIHAMREGRPLKYVGFDGLGHQVRDCLHPEDLARLVARQLTTVGDVTKPMRCNVSGGIASVFSLCELTQWCAARWFAKGATSPDIASDFEPRPFDCPWIVLDSSLANKAWDWKPRWTRSAIWAEVAEHAEQNPGWLDIAQPR